MQFNLLNGCALISAGRLLLVGGTALKAAAYVVIVLVAVAELAMYWLGRQLDSQPAPHRD